MRACCLAAALGAVASPAGAQINVLPEPARGLEMTDTRGERLPLEAPFFDAAGRQVTLGEYFDGSKPAIVLMLYYTCPVLCPTLMGATMETLNDLAFTVGEDFRVIVVSFDDRDRPSEAEGQKQMALLNYARPQSDRVRDGFVFLTSPSAREPKRLGDALGFAYRYLPESGQFSHGSGIHVITPDGRVSRFFTGSALAFDTDDVRLSLLEAGEGKIGSVFDRITLWCYHFDPNAGAYTLQAFRVMQIGGGLTALLLGGLVVRLVIVDRRRRRRNRTDLIPDGAIADGAPLTARASLGQTS